MKLGIALSTIGSLALVFLIAGIIVAQASLPEAARYAEIDNTPMIIQSVPIFLFGACCLFFGIRKIRKHAKNT